MIDVSQAVGSVCYYNILETRFIPASIKCSTQHATGHIFQGSSADVNMNYSTGGPGPFPPLFSREIVFVLDATLNPDNNDNEFPSSGEKTQEAQMT